MGGGGGGGGVVVECVGLVELGEVWRGFVYFVDVMVMVLWRVN